MKIKTLLIGASVLGLASAAHAQTSVVNITGATAFRAAAHEAIKNGFTGNLTVGATGSNAGNANQVIYRGTFTGIPGTTIIRTSWSGSVEGIRALVDAKNTKLQATKFIPVTATFNGTATAPTTSNVTATEALATKNGAVADLAFSDCHVLSTPYAKKAASLSGAEAGVIVFAPSVNKESNVGITNITTQQLREINLRGKLPLSRFTGVSTDTADVYNVQRYDGSGTRVITLAEGGYGAANLTKGYAFPTSNSTASGNLSLTTTPELVPASANTSDYAKFGVTGTTSRVSHSTDFYPTLSGSHLGNGGYVSGGSIASLMVLPGSVNIISVLGTGDARTVMASGNSTKIAAGDCGRIISYNGEILTGLATTGSMTTADKNKVRYGKYTLWSTQILYSLGTPAANSAKAAVYTALTSLTDDELSTNGIGLATMQVTRTLNTAKGGTIDGGLIRP